MLFAIWSKHIPLCKFYFNYLDCEYGGSSYAPVTNYNFPSTFGACSYHNNVVPSHANWQFIGILPI